MSRTLIALCCTATLMALSGCYAGVRMPGRPGPPVVHQPGPPPHAPAHGYRHKHAGGAELRFDAALGVYVVVGHPEIYFYDGWFVRFGGDGWQVSARLDGDWRERPSDWLPPGLRAKHAAKPGPPHKHKKGHKEKRGGGPKPAKGRF